ncbi:hypothetical protein J8J40_32565, partial [Mycobacterium tuberculosis]|nr:hypothetical protein [Mycobacterium tuberculosis]
MLDTIADAAHRYGGEGGRPLSGIVVSRAADAAAAAEISAAIEGAGLAAPLLAITLEEPALNAPLLADVASDLGLTVL